MNANLVAYHRALVRMTMASEQWLEARAAGCDTEPADERWRAADRDRRRAERKLRKTGGESPGDLGR